MELPSHKGGLHTQWHGLRRGFSLVEMLIVISIIGVITAIAIPTIGRIGDAANDNKAKSNARNTAGVSGALSAAGVEHVLPPSLGGAEATTRLLKRGITVQDGAMAGVFFGIPSLSDDEVAPAAAYLEVILFGTVLRMVYDD